MAWQPVEQRGDIVLFRNHETKTQRAGRKNANGKWEKVGRDEWNATPNQQTQEAAAKVDEPNAVAEIMQSGGRGVAGGLAALPPGTWNPLGIAGVLGLSGADYMREWQLGNLLDQQDPTRTPEDVSFFDGSYNPMIQLMGLGIDDEGMRDKFIAEGEKKGDTADSRKNAKRLFDKWKKKMEKAEYEKYWWMSMGGREAKAKALYDAAAGESRVDELPEHMQDFAYGAEALGLGFGGGGAKGVMAMGKWAKNRFPNMGTRGKIATGAMMSSPAVAAMTAPHFVSNEGDNAADENINAALYASMVPGVASFAAQKGLQMLGKRAMKHLPDHGQQQSKDVLHRFLDESPNYNDTPLPSLSDAARQIARQDGAAPVRTLPIHGNLDLARAVPAVNAVNRGKVQKELDKNDLTGQADRQADAFRGGLDTETVGRQDYTDTPGDVIFDNLYGANPDLARGERGVSAESILSAVGRRIYQSEKLDGGYTLDNAPLFRGMDADSDPMRYYAPKIKKLADEAAESGTTQTARAGNALLDKLGRWEGNIPPAHIIDRMKELKGKDVLSLLYAVRAEARKLDGMALKDVANKRRLAKEMEDDILEMLGGTDKRPGIMPDGYTDALKRAGRRYAEEVVPYVRSGDYDQLNIHGIAQTNKGRGKSAARGVGILGKLVNDDGTLNIGKDTVSLYKAALNAMKGAELGGSKYGFTAAAGKMAGGQRQLADAVAQDMVRKMGGKSLDAEDYLKNHLPKIGGSEVYNSLAPAIKRATEPLRHRIAERLAGRKDIGGAEDVDAIIGSYYNQGAKGVAKLQDIAKSVAKKGDNAGDFILSDLSRRVTADDGFEWLLKKDGNGKFSHLDALDSIVGGEKAEIIKSLAVIKHVATSTNKAIKTGGTGTLHDIVREIDDGRGFGKFTNWLKEHANMQLSTISSNFKHLMHRRQGAAPLFSQFYSRYGEGKSARIFTDSLIQEVIDNGKDGAVIGKAFFGKALNEGEKLRFETLEKQLFRKVSIILANEDPAFAKATDHPEDKL
ncbi:MAG: hypothetical protein ACR2PR_09290 [Pseudohongiellaceae bacterium]